MADNDSGICFLFARVAITAESDGIVEPIMIWYSYTFFERVGRTKREREKYRERFVLFFSFRPGQGAVLRTAAQHRLCVYVLG